jgi:hypothetical protein
MLRVWLNNSSYHTSISMLTDPMRTIGTASASMMGAFVFASSMLEQVVLFDTPR